MKWYLIVILIFLMTNNGEHLYFSIFNWVIYLLIIEFLRMADIFCIRSLIRLRVCKYFLFWGLFFHFFDSFLCRTKFFNFVEVQFIYFFSCCFGHCLIQVQGFPGGSVGKEAACSARDMDAVPGSGWPLGGGNDNPLSILAWSSPWAGAWRAIVHMAAKSDTTEVTEHVCTQSKFTKIYSCVFF